MASRIRDVLHKEGGRHGFVEGDLIWMSLDISRPTLATT
jgi:hypothetical protein